MRFPSSFRLFPSFLLVLASLFATSHVAAQEPPSVVSAALKRAGIPSGAVGIYVQEASPKGRRLVADNPDLPLNPASVMKLITTDAALELLGPTFRWKTRAYAGGVQSGDVLNGDLMIKGGGDPKLVIENFWLFLRQIRAAGIRDIRGNLMLDRSMFAPEFYDAAQFDGDPSKPYNAGPDALLLNFKTLTVRFKPDGEGGATKVTLDPPLADFAVRAPALGAGECGDWQSKVQEASDEKSLIFSGVYPAACGEQTWYLHPYTMTGSEFFGDVFRQMWRDLGGSFDGKVTAGVVPPDARQIAEWQSPALPEVIRDINKYSNNVMARQVLLTIAANVGADAPDRPADTVTGGRVVGEWLASKSIAAPELVLDNGAGLSRVGRVSAGSLARLLVSAFGAPTMPEFVSSLPLVGYDGTMRRRLKNQDVAGQAHIKTGTLNNVRAIAGYVLASSGKYYAVVFLINHQNAINGQAAQDALLQWVYDRG
ncbi:MAG: dacB [Herbaspirillum sp.]|nr:dacB [Herbaspirillum sp.]